VAVVCELFLVDLAKWVL